MSARNRSGYILKCLILFSLPFCIGNVPLLSAQDQTISQMVHTSWTGRDGAPQAITALAQTPDGMLWIGTIAGLYTFDGVSFSVFKALPNEPSFSTAVVRELYVSNTGDLWVEFRRRGVARIRQGHVSLFDRADTHADYVDLTYLQEDSNGEMWAILNGAQLVRLGPDGTWHPMPGPIQGQAHFDSLLIDAVSTQWVVANGLLYRRALGQEPYTPTEIQSESAATEAPDHSVWILGRVSGAEKSARDDLQHLDPSGKRLPPRHFPGELANLLPASDGSVWLSLASEGLLRLPPAPMASDHGDKSTQDADRYTLRDGLTSVEAYALLDDAEGNVWTGGISGLDRFERATLVPAIGGARSGHWHVCTNPQGEVWGAEEQSFFFSLKDGRIEQIPGGRYIHGVFCGLDGKVWLIENGMAGYLKNGRIRHLPLVPGEPDSRSLSYDFFVTLAPLSQDRVVAATLTGSGLWIFDHQKWAPFLPGHASGRINVVKAIHGMLYLGYRDGKIEVFQPETRKKLRSVAPGIGEMVAISETPEGVFAIGYDGIAVERGNTFERLRFLYPDSAALFSGLVESRNGDYWLNGVRGILHVARNEMAAAIASPSHPIPTDEVHEGNFVGPASRPVGKESASIDANGKLWFATLNGVVSLDPEHLRVPQHPPQLSIRSITADGSPVRASAKFPPEIQTLDVRYFGLDLTDPSRVVYRYRLEGLDQAWQNVGTRAEAIYTHLRPGTYTFQVMASNGNAVWTQPVSSATFKILPHFYERVWVQGLFVLAALLLTWAAISLRIRYVSAGIRIRAEERADERIRIARELHDTLLQGIQGLLLNFHVAAQKVAADHESRHALERALATADRIIVEGRNRVSRLRSENISDAELKALIEGVADGLRGIASIEFALERKGGRDVLQSHVVDEIFCIAREAVTNAYCHSGASRIVVELDYQKRAFRMTCRDNGRGFDPKVFLTSPTNGHWGLRGMAERAERIGAEFVCTSTPNRGTDINIRVPARLAYLRARTLGQLFKRRGAA